MYISFQGILAGCSHACANMLVVMLNPVRHTIQRFPTVKARVLMDDVSLQWQGPDVQRADGVFAAVRDLCSRLAPIGLLLQPNKSGFLAHSIAAERRVNLPARRLGFRSKAHLRNLGHDLY